MKPVEFWVCALVTGEPECWDGPHTSAALAFASMRKSFNNTAKFGVWEVTAKKVAEPKVAKKPSGSKARTPPKAPSGSKAKTPSRARR